MRLRWPRRLAATLVALALGAGAPPLAAEEPAPSGSPSGLETLVGRPLVKIEVVPQGDRWREGLELRRVRPGQIFSPELARVAMQELLDTGRYADVRAEVEASGEGVVLRLLALPRRIVASIGLSGSPIENEELVRASGLAQGHDLSAPDLPKARQRVQATLRERGYPDARVQLQVTDTDDPMSVVVSVDVEAGAPLKIKDRWFAVWPDPNAPGLQVLLATYGVGPGSVADDVKLGAADRELTRVLVEAGFHQATVGHRVERKPEGALLRVVVQAGPLMKLLFEGNRNFDGSELEDALKLDESSERAPLILAEALRRFYIERGFFDAEVETEERGASDASVRALVFKIREGQQLKIVGREYPCLSGEHGPAAVGSEIDSFLSELPGGELVSGVDEEAVDQLYGPTQGASRRKRPLTLTPWSSYVPEVYDKAIEHLQNLFRSEGYLSASVGPAVLIRRACDRRSPAEKCMPKGPRKRPRTECRYDEIGLPLEEASVDPDLTCKPDPKLGLRCEPDAVLHLPIKLGPRTYIQDVVFEGNQTISARELFTVAELEPGTPASQIELDKARRRILDAYAEEGFAFAEVDAALDLSSDHTRARARFTIGERERVRVSRIEIRGARLTSESLIRRRVALQVGELYRRSLVRKTEERLATLGVFASVSVGFEDPYVPAREKVVIITVDERKPQRLDVRPGFSTGEGFRISFEYGHNNLFGQAIGFTARTQLAYLPNAFIFEDDVRRKYEELTDAERIERRNTLALEFPEIGLGPLFRLSVEGVDVRDIARDYGQTKDAAIVTLMFRPDVRLSFQLGASLELNEATIFGKEDQDQALTQYLQENQDERNKFRVPDGQTLAIAERIGATWDRRDSPLDATSGTFISLGAEHVYAFPVGETAQDKQEEATNSPFEAVESDFMRYTNRVAGYVRLSRKGLAFAASFRWGVNQQLTSGSQTYPDRLFFMGGVDTIRGFAQDSLVPEDIAQLILHPPPPEVPPQYADSGYVPAPPLTIDQVLIRGGDLFINPRVELRVPLTDTVQTALFLDAGNLWADPQEIYQSFRLRYSVGSGLRIGTPIGPLVFDYGFNTERVLDALFPERRFKRYWESLGAFHFSIGLF